ncbi:MAG TPA: Shikimate dehydrogenase (NADP(+)) [Hyphomicrobiaceae bacterium MAG_BT-2024]
MGKNKQTVIMPKACVIGWPVKHSLSPKLHRHWINHYNLNADYRHEEIEPDDVVEFIGSLAKHGYVGANVTMPYKDVAFQVSKPDKRANFVESANTLWIENDVIRATNTDIEGFVHALDARAPGWDHRSNEALVLGAGGAGRAVIYGLLERGITRVHVVNRDLHKVSDLQKKLGNSVIAHKWDAVPSLVGRSTLLVNTTPLGMIGHEPLRIDINSLPSTAVVCDIVYIPLETPLLAAAKALKLVTLNGLDMLLHQAVRGFELWFGIRPKVTQKLCNLLAADINRTY